MRRKKISLFIASILILFSTGCASLNGNVPFQYQPSLLASSETINKDAGMNLLIDQRPEGDKSYTKSIKDIPEKVTSKLIEDFEKSRLFKDIHFSSKTGDALIIEGTVNRFMWKLYDTPIGYVPLLNIVLFFGVPCYESYGIADITLTIKDSANNRVLGKFHSESKVTDEYSIYNFKAGEAGAELAEALRNVAKDLKQQIAHSIK